MARTYMPNLYLLPIGTHVQGLWYVTKRCSGKGGYFSVKIRPKDTTEQNATIVFLDTRLSGSPLIATYSLGKPLKFSTKENLEVNLLLDVKARELTWYVEN